MFLLILASIHYLLKQNPIWHNRTLCSSPLFLTREKKFPFISKDFFKERNPTTLLSFQLFPALHRNILNSNPSNHFCHFLPPKPKYVYFQVSVSLCPMKLSYIPLQQAHCLQKSVTVGQKLNKKYMKPIFIFHSAPFLILAILLSKLYNFLNV